jgi:molybdopterin-binding protein
MNTLPGKITDISVSGSLSMAHVDVAGNLFSAIVIDTPETASYLASGKEISVVFKETEVIIGTGKEYAVSLQNRLQGKIIEIESGDLLAALAEFDKLMDFKESELFAKAKELLAKEGYSIGASLESWTSKRLIEIQNSRLQNRTNINLDYRLSMKKS